MTDNIAINEMEARMDRAMTDAVEDPLAAAAEMYEAMAKAFDEAKIAELALKVYRTGMDLILMTDDQLSLIVRWGKRNEIFDAVIELDRRVQLLK